MRMTHSAPPVSSRDLEAWRILCRQEMACQILHHSFFSRAGRTESYLLRAGPKIAGYGAHVVAGPWKGTRTLFEFYLSPRFRNQAFGLFRELIRAGDASGMRAQTNDVLASAMLFAHCQDIVTEKTVFHNLLTTRHALPGAAFRRVSAEESAALAARAGRPSANGRLKSTA